MKATPYAPLTNTQPGTLGVQIEDEAPIPSGFWNMAFVFWLATAFILYSKFLDSVLTGFYIPKVVILLTAIFFLVSGRPLYFLKSTAGKIMLGLIFWVSFTMIFSVWKGGSMPMYSMLLQSAFFFTLAAGLPGTITHVRQSLYTLAFSALVAALLSFKFGEDRDGRLAMISGSYHDPNYLAMALAAAVPLLWQVAVTAQSKALKGLAWLGMPVLLLVMAKAGSRGAMLAFGVMLLLLFLISSVRIKIVLVLVTAIGMAVVLATLPGYVKERYLTLFSVDEPPASNDAANPDLDRLKGDVGSSQERKRLLMESISLTFEHPVVGVGPGNFQTAVFDEARAAGIKHNEWMATHNSYTQLSCETGLPGLILLLCLLGSSFHNVIVVLKGSAPNGEKPDRATYATAKALLLSLAVVCVCVFFLAIVYDFPLYVWAGLTVGLRRVYDHRKVIQNPLSEEPEVLFSPKPAFAPAYPPTLAERAAQPRTHRVSGRPVRFNRFR